MSTCNIDLINYNLVKNCSKCGIIQLKMNFYKDKPKKDGLFIHCKICCKSRRKKYYLKNREREIRYSKNYYDEHRDRQLQNHKNYINNRRKIDLSFKLSQKLRSRTYNAFETQNVSKNNKTFELLGCSPSFFQKWIQFQLFGNMTLENYGKVWENDHCLPINSFILLNESEVKKCFSWINLRPMYGNENNSKKAKVDRRLYLLQEIKAHYFLKTWNIIKLFE